MANFLRIDHIALHVRNLNISREFYKNHFGFSDYYKQVTASGIEIYYMKLGDTILELVGRHDLKIGGFHWCMETDDFDDAVSQLEKNKVKLIQEPHPTDAREPREQGWKRAVFEGPDGEHVEIRG